MWSKRTGSRWVWRLIPPILSIPLDTVSPPGLSHHVKASLGRRDSIMVSPSETYPLDSQNTEHRICNNHFIICRSSITSLPLSVDRSMCAASPKQTGRSNVLCATQRTKDKLSLDLDSNWIGRALLLASPVQTWLSVSVWCGMCLTSPCLIGNEEHEGWWPGPWRPSRTSPPVTERFSAITPAAAN